MFACRIHTDLQGSGQAAGGGAGEVGQLDGTSPPQAVVYSDGTIRWVRPAVVSVTARHEFRANSWIAAIRLGSWTYDDARLRLRALRSSASGTSGTAVDLDVSNYAAGDQWTLIEHSGRRVEMAAGVGARDGGGSNQHMMMSPARAAASGLDDCCQRHQNAAAGATLSPATETFVTFNYGFKLRKKLGPSLLVTGTGR